LAVLEWHFFPLLALAPPSLAMPTTTRATGRAEEDVLRISTRRSSRLNQSQASESVVVKGEEPKLKRRRIIPEESLESRRRTAVCAEKVKTSHPKPCRSTPIDISQREKALVKKERDIKRRSDELDELLSKMVEKEERASLQAAQREAKATLSQLEEHFTCALCYDIMACPISLNPGQCGHTFCALCILKWFFSRLHKACGGWHQSVDCPICRSLLIITPDHSPRSDITFPFTPNRTVDAVVRDLVGKLADFPSFDTVASKATKEGKKTEEDQEMLAMAEWRIGGTTRAEWLRRDLTGREEINEITKKWKNLNSKDFVDLKTKLGV